MANYIKVENQYYILASSSLADDRTIVLKDGDSFGIFDRYGDIHPIGHGAQGLYHEGTRFISQLELMIDNQKPIFLSSSLKEQNEILTADLTNPDLEKDGLIIEKGTLHIHRTKFLFEGVAYEKVVFSNFGSEQLPVSVCFSFDSDFKDIFQVRGMVRKKMGKKEKAQVVDDNIVLSYMGLDKINRKSIVSFNTKASDISPDDITFEMNLAPKMAEELVFSISFEIGKKKPRVYTFDNAKELMLKALMDNKAASCEIYTSNEHFNKWISRSDSDLQTMISQTEHGPYPYAGVPWYSTPFGRDGIITAWQCLWTNPGLAKGVLAYLAKTQATELNDFQDAEPGKIFHEKRGGEMAEMGEIPFKMYYGTIDATPLFIGLAGAYYERTADLDFIREIWPNIEKAIDWIDNYGDLDKDGFVEYKKKSEKGLINQGWKDSHDSIFYESGEMANGAIALCEIQGYVFDAKIKAAAMALELGLTEKAEKLKNEAVELKSRFQDKFWSDDKNTFVIALDGQKYKCNVMASNAGHCLFSEIVRDQEAEKLVKSLINKTMFSGWGIRTLATSEIRYNPMSYHNGSIWPHDNALIAFGMAKYGYKEEVLKVLQGLYETSMFIPNQRLPELFCGFEKRRSEGPTDYPVACSPQAWAVTSVHMLVQAMLGIRIVAKENSIYFHQPVLPDYVNEITIKNIEVNGNHLVLQIRKHGSEIFIHTLYNDGDVKIRLTEEKYPMELTVLSEVLY